MAKLAKAVWSCILLFGVFEAGRLSKACDQFEDGLVERLKNKVVVNVNFEEVKDGVSGN
mgnify:CR=1 FL=1